VDGGSPAKGYTVYGDSVHCIENLIDNFNILWGQSSRSGHVPVYRKRGILSLRLLAGSTAFRSTGLGRTTGNVLIALVRTTCGRNLVHRRSSRSANLLRMPDLPAKIALHVPYRAVGVVVLTPTSITRLVRLALRGLLTRIILLRSCLLGLSRTAITRLSLMS